MKKILVVDDEEKIRLIMAQSQILCDAGFLS